MDDLDEDEIMLNRILTEFEGPGPDFPSEGDQRTRDAALQE